MKCFWLPVCSPDGEIDLTMQMNKTNLEISYSTAYVRPGVVTLPCDIDEDGENYLKCFWLPVCNPDSEIDVPAEISLQHLVNYDPYLMFNSWDSVNPNPCGLVLFSQQQGKNKLWFFFTSFEFWT